MKLQFPAWRTVTLALLALAFLAACATRPPLAPYRFALIGDTQYNAGEEARFPALLDAISRENVAFVVHVGDFKAGSNSLCTDELFQRRYQEFDRSAHPFIFLPGDNEWVDCRRPTNGSYAPLERLDKLRALFFAKPESLGKTRRAVMRQADVFANDPVLRRYSENLMWVHAGVVYVSVNVQGSNDNRGFTDADDAEWSERLSANTRWITHAMTRARAGDITAIVLFLQANPGFEESPSLVEKSAYKPFLESFEAQARAFEKPILFAHGDTHTFRTGPYTSPLDKRALPNVKRVEGYGSPFVNWVNVTVDTSNRSNPFAISSGNFQAVPPN
jgi:hypothetical protein